MLRRKTFKTVTFAMATLSVCLALGGTRTSLAQAPYPPGMGGQYQPGGTPQPGATYPPGMGGQYQPGRTPEPGATYPPGIGGQYQPGATSRPGTR